MGKLLLKLLRDLKEFKGQFISITLVIAVGAFFFAGFSTFSKNLSEYSSKYYEDSNLTDLWVYFDSISPEDINIFRQIDEIKNIEGRYVLDVNQKFDEVTTTLKLHSIPENNKINKIQIIGGGRPTNFQSIVIDTDYAKEHNFSIGDEIEISTPFNDILLKISGFGESSEYTIKSRDTSDFPPNHKEYGIAYVSESTMAYITGNNNYNEVLIDVDDPTDAELVESKIIETSEQTNFLYTLKRDLNLSYKQFTGEIKQQEELAKILPLIFFLVAAVITFLTVSRLVDSQRTQIGIMKALGNNNLKIISHYLGYAMITGLVGGIIGSVLGSIFLPEIFMDQVRAIVSLPGFRINIYYENIVLASLFSVFFGVISSYLSCKKILKESASSGMRAKPPKEVRSTSLEKNTKLWEKLSYGNKLILRNILLNKKRAIYSSLGIVCCVSLLILSFGYLDSRELLIDKQYNEVHQYDLKVVYNTPIEDRNNLGIPINSLYYNTLAETNVVITNIDEVVDSNLIITSKENNFINNYDYNGTLLPLDNQGVIIAERFAKNYNLSKGDTLSLKLIGSEYKGRTIDVKISNISVQYINQEIFATPELLTKLGVNFPPSTLLIKAQDSMDIDNIYNTFNTMNNVKEVKSIDEVQKITESGLQNLFNMIVVLIICAVVLSSAAIYNISIINITERIRELATLKVLGYHRNKINKLIFIENILITIFGIVVGIPTGIVLYISIIKRFTLDNMVFPIILSLDSILFPIIITISVTILCTLSLRRTVKNINMIESLKSIE
ncbi:ABC transporter permease [Chengkuizengella axinellae]|uniref:FtsX-like permease family protein n=1 Tax=Chengkuizengella axinellae TaxID=3064388 RepID=A0ABT9J600_9BACL|nr:ABC transporter permease [Chengkuizengella sp. 2205SS18-9]MDP5277036.1 FtsX-like permease family protein [Chengkuizengella sp. 2205SS18-9]